MKRTTTLILIAGLAAALAGCAQMQASGARDQSYDFGQLDRVAVVKIDGRLQSEADKNQLTDLINQRLLAKGYSPVERQQVKSVMAERDFQVSSATEAADLGQLLNVDAAVIANVPQYQEELSMSLKMVDVENASILWTSSGTASTGGEVSKIAAGVTGAVAGAAVGGDATDSTIGAAAGGAAGGAAGATIGEQLTPQKREQASKLIGKLFESLPAQIGG